MSYGVTPTGFNRKPLEVILAEMEMSLMTEFGPDVVQTPQSPLGQINGLMADLITSLWEVAEEVYQSYDPDQAEGNRLDQLAKLRLLRRDVDEVDMLFRRAITNQGRARIDVADMIRALVALPGVTYTQVFINDTQEVDDNGMFPGSVCVAVLGGDNDEVASVVRRYIVPGVIMSGNTSISATLDGFCRTLTILRPIVIPVKLNIKVRVRKDVFGCPPPAPVTIRDGLLADFNGTEVDDRRINNGDSITDYRIRSAIEARHSNVEFVSFEGERDGLGMQPGSVAIGFIEIASFKPEDVVVEVI